MDATEGLDATGGRSGAAPIGPVNSASSTDEDAVPGVALAADGRIVSLTPHNGLQKSNCLGIPLQRKRLPHVSVLRRLLGPRAVKLMLLLRRLVSALEAGCVSGRTLQEPERQCCIQQPVEFSGADPCCASSAAKRCASQTSQSSQETEDSLPARHTSRRKASKNKASRRSRLKRKSAASREVSLSLSFPELMDA